MKNPIGIGLSLNNIGALYYRLGDIPQALEYYSSALKMQEKNRDAQGNIKDKKGMAMSLSNLGIAASVQNNDSLALNYYFKSFKLREEIAETKGIINSYGNIGASYKNMKRFDLAIKYFIMGLALSEQEKDPMLIAYCLSNLGNTYDITGNYEKSLELGLRSLKIREALHDKSGISSSLGIIAKSYLKQGNLNEAKKYAEQSLNSAKEIGFPENLKYTSNLLSDIYSKQGNWKEAYRMQVLFKQMSDSINNEINKKTSIQKAFQYEYDKKAAADSIRAFEERRVFEAQLKQEKTQRYALYGGVFLIALFSIFMFNRFKITQKQKQIIEKQKIEVDKAYEHLHEKNKEIMDSIHYAARIQRSLITNEKYIASQLRKLKG